jgi:hypothetical protein
MVEQAISLIPQKINLKYEKYKLKIKSFCITKFARSSLAIVWKSTRSVVPLESAITSVGTVVGRSAATSTSSKPCYWKEFKYQKLLLVR